MRKNRPFVMGFAGRIVFLAVVILTCASAKELPSLHDAEEEPWKMTFLSKNVSGHYAFTQDSKWVVFISRTEGLVAMHPEGGQKRILAPGTGPGKFPKPPVPKPHAKNKGLGAPPLMTDSESSAANKILGSFQITPDSKTVVYDLSGKLFSVAIDGGEPKFIAHVDKLSRLTILADSQRLIYTKSGSAGYIARIDGSGSPRILLPSHPLGIIYKVTPDQKHVVYRASTDVRIKKLDGSGDRTMTPNSEKLDLLFLVKGGAIVSQGRVAYFAPFDGSGPVLAMPKAMKEFAWSPYANVSGAGFILHDQEHNLHYFDIKSRKSTQLNTPLKNGQRTTTLTKFVGQKVLYTVVSPEKEKRAQKEKTKSKNAPSKERQLNKRQWELREVGLDGEAHNTILSANGLRTLVVKATPDQKQLILHAHRSDDTMAFFSANRQNRKIRRITKDMVGWSNFYVSSSSRFILFGVPTRRKQPRTYDLYSLVLR